MIRILQMKFPRKYFLVPALFSLIFSSCEGQSISVVKDSISIAYAEQITSFSPLNYESNNRKYLSNIYEKLVNYDKTFNFESGLAVSWGRFDDLTWEFKLREGVLFHDGSTFDADDAVYSLLTAMTDQDSQLDSILSNISSVDIVEAYKIRVVTKVPDPLLLNKLTNVFIFSADFVDFDAPVGTGPYAMTSYDGEKMLLTAFDSYWGTVPMYKSVELSAIQDPDRRRDAILMSEVDVLANIPPQYVDVLEENDITVNAFPSLEVSFLMFNFDGVFADSNLRNAAYYALSTDYASKLGSGYLLDSNQYAASGIFGYSLDVPDRVRDLAVAKDFRDLYSGDVSVTLDIPEGLEKLGEKVAEDLAEIDITVTVNPMEDSEFEQKVLLSQSDFYFFGWKYDLADISDFLETIVHTKTDEYGNFNGMNYSNEVVDGYIEDTSKFFNIQERRTMLNLITQNLFEDKIGIPLFEAELLYGIRLEVSWDIRLDGLILASEIR